MRLGYNTNGLAHHSLPAAIGLLAEIGYQSVAITLDHGCLNPLGENFHRDLGETAELLARHNLRSVIETGARYLLDPHAKHEPTLVSFSEEGRRRRIDFLRRAIDAAAFLNSDCVSLWSGVVNRTEAPDESKRRLVLGLNEISDYAERRGVTLGFEPEPGMLIDTMPAFEDLCDRVQSPQFALTLDVGHLHCQGETPIEDYIRRYGDRIVNVHIEDMRRGVHEHLMFGEGEMDFLPIIAALTDIGYDGGVHVELSRHSHVGPVAARQAFEFLNSLIKGVNHERTEARGQNKS
jgi:sugar phosphate isomerase/epimerase